uniref:Uncharacterized protein n=1 Tax=uncultured marine virus TaxID=186617 RepID=A0A0F7L730_9VIRU|nr:hypothetical protein Daci_1943 [uncultured marine virus]
MFLQFLLDDLLKDHPLKLVHLVLQLCCYLLDTYCLTSVSLQLILLIVYLLLIQQHFFHRICVA